MALSDYQWALAGVVFGRGTVYHLTSISGLGTGKKRDRVFQTPGGDGVEWGREHRDGNTITFEGEIRCDGDPAAAYAAYLAMRAAFNGSTRTSPRTTETLTMKMPGQPEATIVGRPDMFDGPLTRLGIGRIAFTATFTAAEPLAV